MPAEPTAARDPVVVPGLSDSDAIELLTRGDLAIEGRLVDASNTTLRAVVTASGVTGRCVYKPVAGERPLWDFPDGTLADRERAAYQVSTAMGWGVVPPTVLRDGPFGHGMLQLWIDEQRQTDEPVLGFVPARRLPQGWLRVASARDSAGRGYALAHADDPLLARLAVFDAVVNNADRKGGHVIATVDGRVFGVDHGVCFNTDYKLRTILWGWAGLPIPPEMIEVLHRLRDALSGQLGAELAQRLTRAEVRATMARVDRLVAVGCYPEPVEDRPAMPWPPM